MFVTPPPSPVRSESRFLPSGFPSGFRARSARLLLAAFTLALAAVACSAGSSLDEIRKQQAVGNYAATIEPLRELLAEDRSNAEVNYRYGLALVQTGQRGLAEWSLRKAMEDPEWRLPAGRLLAFGEAVAGNYDPAIATLTELIEEYPDDLDLLNLRANTYAHSRRYLEEALADADRVFELDPDNTDAFEPRILALLGLDRIDEAAEAIAELGRRLEKTNDPEMQGWHCATAALFAFESREIDLAKERWEDCTERFPGHANVVSNALSFYDARLEFDRSLEILRRAVEARPESRDFRIQLAGRLRAKGEADEARAVLMAATETDDTRAAATAWFDLGKHYQDLRDDEKALEAFEKSISLVEQVGPAMAQMQLEYADALVLAGRYDRALELADEIKVPAYREVLIARVAQERGDPKLALEHFEEAFRLWPDNPWARYYAALAAEALGQFDLAIASYRDSVRIAVGATDARTRLARLHLAEGKPREAIYILRLQVETQPLDVAGELLTLRIWGHLKQVGSIQVQLDRIRQQRPGLHALAVAAAAEGLAEAGGPADGVKLVRNVEGVDLTSPAYADALRALVRYSSEAGLGGAREDVRAALAAHPDAAVLHEVEGLRLELAGDPEAARSAYERALELDPEEARARVGLCRIAPESPADARIALCQRALAASPGDPDASLAAAEALTAAGRRDDAAQVLGEGLAAHPYDASLAEALAATLEAGPAPDRERIESLHQRAARFTPEPATSPAATGQKRSGQG